MSLKLSSGGVVDATGKIVKEVKVESDPDALVSFLQGLGLPLARIGLEAGPLSQWLHAGLTQAAFETVLLETRHGPASRPTITSRSPATTTRYRGSGSARSSRRAPALRRRQHRQEGQGPAPILRPLSTMTTPHNTGQSWRWRNQATLWITV